MRHIGKLLKVLTLSTTTLAMGVVPVAAAIGQVPSHATLPPNMAEMMEALSAPSAVIRDGLVILADDCDDEQFDNTRNDPRSRSRGPTGGRFTTSAPMRVDCLNETRAKQLNKNTAQKIILRLKDTDRDCSVITKHYRLDCLANRYEDIARGLRSGGESGQVKGAFEKAAKDLRSIVRQTADPAAPKARFNARTPSGGTKPISSRKLTAVRPDLQIRADAAAEKVIRELSTKLLRSSEGSNRRQVYFAEIAQAVDSNKVLLRS